MRWMLILALGLLSLACNDTPSSGLPTTRMTIGRETFTLEIAAEPVARETGLMRRDSMPADRGMIFIFPSERELRFWMKNTRIPLDILFVDRNGKVVRIAQMEPYIGEAYSEAPARYAIELNRGAAARAGVQQGDLLELPEAVRTADVPR